MELKICLLFVFLICRTNGLDDPMSVIWDTDTEPTEYTYTPAPSVPPTSPPIVTTTQVPDCRVSGLPGKCVQGRQFCKTPYAGEGAVSWRTTDICPNGICCALGDIVSPSHTPDTTTTSTTIRPPPGWPPAVIPGPAVNPGSTAGSATTGSNSAQQNGCGKRNSNGQFFRGQSTTAKFGEFPWTVAVFKVINGKEEYSCVGSLIHPRVVLTVASRFDRAGQFRVRVGDHDLSNRRERRGHQVREVVEAITHENFDDASGSYDIGLLILDKDIKKEQHINYVCLPKADQVTPPSTACVMTGWGSETMEGKLRNKPKLIEVPIVGSDICLSQLRVGLENDYYELDPSMMCAGGNGQDACKGDGGGPLMCPYPGQTENQSNQRYYQAGIVSWGVECNKDTLPGVYADVANLRGWIDEKLQKKGFGSEYYTYNP